jgi:DNA-binding transcriptional regulator YiaG
MNLFSYCGLKKEVFSLSFPDRLREKRLQLNLSQAELAALVGVSTRSIQNYELGSRRPHTSKRAEAGRRPAPASRP